MPDRETAPPAERHATPGAVLDPLIADLLEWIGPGSRPYSKVIEAWRTSCPRLPVWEEASDMRLLSRHRGEDGVALVSVSATGRRWLREQGERQGAPPEPARALDAAAPITAAP